MLESPEVARMVGCSSHTVARLAREYSLGDVLPRSGTRGGPVRSFSVLDAELVRILFRGKVGRHGSFADSKKRERLAEVARELRQIVREIEGK